MSRSLAALFRTKLRAVLVRAQVFTLRRVWHMQIGTGVRISLKARLDRTNPQGVVIGDWTGIGAGAVVLTHDFIGDRHVTTRIGRNCHIGMNAIILPGVTVGDECIVAPGAIVMRDVPPHSLVMCNPARVMESGLSLGRWGQRLPAPADHSTEETQEVHHHVEQQDRPAA
ncbi:acyltransferase [Paracoccaceae bacterium GXU_MW_L88]